VAKAMNNGFVYDGIYSKFRQKIFGNSSRELAPETFLVCIQNHDQVGNRIKGNRLSTILSPSSQRLAASFLILAPYLPLLFMGEEYGETSPFHYFIDHGDAGLVEAVRKGRQAESRDFNWSGTMSDPFNQNTFNQSKLQWDLAQQEPHRSLLNFYQDLIRLRKSWGLSGRLKRKDIKVYDREGEDWFALEYRLSGEKHYGIVFSNSKITKEISLPFRGKKFEELLHSENQKYGGSLKNEKRRHLRTLKIGPQCAIAGRIRS